MARARRPTSLPPPFLKRVWLSEERMPAGEAAAAYPFSLPILRYGLDIAFARAVTIVVGENGSGKSTLLEAIATAAGFSEGGGAQGMHAVAPFERSGDDGGALGELLRCSWLPQVRNGWFFRAETFFSVARYLDDAGSLHAGFLRASHGEGFLTFFEERMNRQGLFILDEPESALSPTKQIEFLRILRRLQRAETCQVVIATHSPLLMALPKADLWALDTHGLRPTRLKDTAHFRLYREFVNYPHETIKAMIE